MSVVNSVCLAVHQFMCWYLGLFDLLNPVIGGFAALMVVLTLPMALLAGLAFLAERLDRASWERRFRARLES